MVAVATLLLLVTLEVDMVTVDVVPVVVRFGKLWAPIRGDVAVLITFRPKVLVLLSLLLRLKFMLLVALVRAMFATRRTKDSIRLEASREDRLGTLALELMGAPAASRELTESLLLAEELRGRCDAASLFDDSATKLTSGELTLTIPIDIAPDSPELRIEASGPDFLSAFSLAVSAVKVLVLALDVDPAPPWGKISAERTTMGS